MARALKEEEDEDEEEGGAMMAAPCCASARACGSAAAPARCAPLPSAAGRVAVGWAVAGGRPRVSLLGAGRWL